MSETQIVPTLLVIYTEQLAECRDFYSGLGLALVPEQHGTGPVHFAAEIGGGLVLELYPAASADRATGRLRIGFSIAATEDMPAGDHSLRDPDGRVVAVTAVEPAAGRGSASATGPAAARS